MNQSLRFLVLMFAVFFAPAFAHAEIFSRTKTDWVAEVIFKSGASGSGFLIDNQSNQWFVTAKHVLFNQDGTLIADSGVLRSFTNYGTSNQIRIEIDFKQALVANSLLPHSTHDVVVCLISTDFNEKKVRLMPYVKRLDTSIANLLVIPTHMIGSFHQANVGNQVFMIGFPRSLGLKEMAQLDHEQPLLRGGFIAGTNPAKSTIVVDCAAYFGNSGGPVIQLENYPTERHRLIGLVSQLVPQQSAFAVGKPPVRFEYINSGYAILEPMDFVFELINQYRVNQSTTERSVP